MRYHIDTIPVWDAVKLEGECPLCALRRRNELLDVERCLGASVMEPDTRIKVNDVGFCARHQVLLYEQKNRLGHALMMHTHLKETIKKLGPIMESARAAGSKSASASALRRWTGKTEGKADLKAAAEKILSMSRSCVLCESIEENTRRYAYTLLHLYKTDASFRAAFSGQPCRSSSSTLLSMICSCSAPVRYPARTKGDRPAARASSNIRCRSG